MFESETSMVRLERVSKVFGRTVRRRRPLRMPVERRRGIVRLPPEARTRSARRRVDVGPDARYVVRDVSLDVHRGQILGLIGPSGCGKTTTIRLMLGVYVPTAGTVKVHGLDPTRFTRRVRERIGYMPQFFVLYPNLSVEQTLNFMASVYGLGMRYRRRRIEEVLELVELTKARKQRAERLSGGMKRRLELACALLHEPSILFFDEPTAGIDPVLRARFWDHFHALRDQGNTLFVTTQYVTEAEYCDRVALMDEGRVVALGSPRELRRRALGGEVIDIESSGSAAEPGPSGPSGAKGAFSAESLEVVREVPGIRRVESVSLYRLRAYVESSAADVLPLVLNALERHGIEVASAQEFSPSFDEIFVRLLRARR
jgi:ABC-2 type transport system ATP-binding protein